MKYLTVAEVMEILKGAPPDAYIRLEHDEEDERCDFWITDESIWLHSGMQKTGQQSPMDRDVPVIRFSIEEF